MMPDLIFALCAVIFALFAVVWTVMQDKKQP
jgi:hypothetical protein